MYKSSSIMKIEFLNYKNVVLIIFLSFSTFFLSIYELFYGTHYR